MKYFNFYLIICITSVLFITSCKTDFEVDAPWKDITVVYGLLNQNDTVHLIKINKAFLGNENAYTMAKVSDSINYPNAVVTLEERNSDGLLKKTITLTKTTEYVKDTGIFASDNNIVYKTTEKLDSTCTYYLKINIPHKPLITSSTSLINGLNVFYNGNIISFVPTSPMRVMWNSTPNGRLYELTIRFFYYEIKDNDTTLKYLDWVQRSSTSKKLDGRETMDLSISGDAFYQFIASKVQPDPNAKRYVKKKTFNFMFLVGGDELNTYIDINHASSTVVQDKPTFTNISNGIGIFSCKYNKTVYGKELFYESIDSLAKGKYTKNLGFIDYMSTYNIWNTYNNSYNK